MRTPKKLFRSVLSGTLALAIVSSYVITPAIAHGAAAEETETAVTPDLTGAAAEEYANEGGIVYKVEETTAAAAATESTVLAATDTDVMPTTTAAEAASAPSPAAATAATANAKNVFFIFLKI